MNYLWTQIDCKHARHDRQVTKQVAHSCILTAVMVTQDTDQRRRNGGNWVH